MVGLALILTFVELQAVTLPLAVHHTTDATIQTVAMTTVGHVTVLALVAQCTVAGVVPFKVGAVGAILTDGLCLVTLVNVQLTELSCMPHSQGPML